jgi:hypothetical protein
VLDANAVGVELHDAQLKIDLEPLHFVIDPNAQEVVLHQEQVNECIDQIARHGGAELRFTARLQGLTGSGRRYRSRRLGEPQPGQINLGDADVDGRPAQFKVQVVEAGLTKPPADVALNSISELIILSACLLILDERLPISVSF